MDGKKLRKDSDSQKFMDKFLNRLKMTKHANSTEKVVAGSGSSSDAARKSVTPTSSSTESKPSGLWDSPGKITADNMMQLSDQLQQLLESLQEMREITYYTYDYPNQLNTKLEKEALELRNLFRDVRAAAIDIDRLRKQRHIVKKEKSMAQKRLDKLREEEIKELESIINVYAKPLFCKWESIKNTQKPEVLENFMNEVMGKSTAMEILQELIKRKLCKLSKKQSTSTPFALKRNISSSNMSGNKMKNQERTTSSWNIANAQDVVKVATQSSERAPKPSVERDIIRVNRRKRQREIREDRRRQSAETNVSTVNNINSIINSSDPNSNGLDLQLVPIDSLGSEEFDDSSRTTMATSNPATTRSSPPVVNIEYTSDDDSVSLSSSDFIIENFVHGTNTEMQTDLQNEMRNVLQALFGEIRQIPQLGYGGRNRLNNSGNDLRSPRTASH